MIKGYPYARMDFHGDPNLAIRDGERWGAIGKKKHFDHFFLFLSFTIYFVFSMYLRLTIDFYMQTLESFDPWIHPIFNMLETHNRNQLEYRLL